MYALPVQDTAVGLIETMRVRGGLIPFLERHLARLGRSLAALSLPVPTEDLEWLIAQRVDDADAVLRLEVTDGRPTVTVRPLPAMDPPRVITATVPHVPYPHKTTAREVFERAGSEAWAAGADDALLLTSGRLVAEGTVCSVFWWDGGVLRTPALGLGILPGIARARIEELHPLMEGPWPRSALDRHSVFFANAVRGIIPLAELDQRAVPSDRRTARLAASFWEL
jgi:branched-subunit amino acid aminotransferase/4-amino-4-deoxychorismate lyase